MKQLTKILHLEDTRFDVEMVERELRKTDINFTIKVVDNKKDFETAIIDFKPDIVLSDHSLASFDSVRALQLLQALSRNTPFILVTSTVSEEFAADIIKMGAADYILKDRLKRLPAAILAALKRQHSEDAKQKAERQIEKSENNLRIIFENTSEGFLLLDEHGIVKAFNQKSQEYAFFVREKKMQVGQPITDSINSHLEIIFKQIMSEVFNGETVQYELLHNGDDENKRWIHFSLRPVIKSGKITGVCITGRDITQKKIAEQQKDFDSNNLQALINNTGDFIWSIDCDYNLITSNKPFDRMFMALSGKSPVRGETVFMKKMNARQVDLYQGFYKRACTGESFTGIDNTIEGLWSEISFYPIYEGEIVVGTACFSRNITDRVEAEQTIRKSFEENRLLASKMSAIINTLPVNIALLDQNGVIIAVNDSWKDFSDANAFVGNDYSLGENYINISETATGDASVEGKSVAAGIRSILDNTSKEFVFEYTCHAPHIKRWFRMMVTPLRDKEYGGAVVMHLDISEVHRLEEERLINKLNEQKEITLAMLHGQEKERNYIGRELHDNINQILAGTKLYLGHAGNQNKEFKKLIMYPLELIDSSIEEIRILCRNLVTPLKNIDLESLIKDLIIKFSDTDTKTDFTCNLSMDISDDLKLNIYRIIQEQLNNILKYAKATNIQIVMNTVEKQIFFSITDDGKGFDVAQKRNGIGISNMINRVESFNGKISIESEPGNGCRVAISIPLCDYLLSK